MNITKTRRVTALVDEQIEYTVDGDTFRKHLADGLTSEEALDEIRGEGEAFTDSYTSVVDEVLMEHEVHVEVD